VTITSRQAKETTLTEHADHSDPVTLERAGWDALSTSGDAARAFYEHVLDDTVVMLLPGGFVLDDRRRIIDSMAGAPWSSYALDDVRCAAIGGDVALVTYAAVAERDGQRYSALMSSLYVRRQGLWKLAFHQQTPR
jgi:hypothetical protein